MDYVFNYFSNEEPKVEKPIVEKLKVEKPIVEKLKVEKPKVEKPIVEKLKVEKPKVEKPKVEKLKVEKPKVEKPKVEKLKVEKPIDEKLKVEKPKVEENKFVYYDNNDYFDLQILQLPVRKHKKKNIRLKRPIDKRLPNVDLGINIILCSKSKLNNSTLIANLIENSQFYKGYFHNTYLLGKSNFKSLNQIYNMYSDTCFDTITNELLNDISNKEIKKSKNACFIFDHCDNYNKLSKLLNISSNFRTILNSRNGGGMLLISDTCYSKIPQRLRNSANTFIIGKLTDEDYHLIANDLGDLFSSSEELFVKLKENIILDNDYLILMIEGNKIHQKACIYKNWEELI